MRAINGEGPAAAVAANGAQKERSQAPFSQAPIRPATHRQIAPLTIAIPVSLARELGLIRDWAPPPPEARLRHLARALHQLGERPLFEMFREVANGADLWERLSVYAQIDEPPVRRARSR